MRFRIGTPRHGPPPGFRLLLLARTGPVVPGWTYQAETEMVGRVRGC